MRATAGDRHKDLAATSVAAVFGAGVAAVQLRHGIVPLLDTVTYWSGAESVATGRLFGTTLAPSFSNYDAVEFLDRGGRLPFVDFPVAYPLIAGILGFLIGTRAALHILTVIAVAAIAAAIVIGHRVGRPSSQDPSESQSSSNVRTGLVVAFACLISLQPAMRLVTQGTLSEPLFIAVTVLLVIALARYRAGGHWAPVVGLVIASSLLRFLGAPLALLAGWEHLHRTRRPFRSFVWTAAMILPAGMNIAAASLAGGGHSAGWRGLDRVDAEVFVRSVGGWFDASQGDIRRTYFTTEGPALWSWPLTVIVLTAMAWGVFAVVRRRSSTNAVAELALAAAAILTCGLIAGILGFDALVIADNRLMLPAGVLVMSAIVWTAAIRIPASPASLVAATCAITLWGLTAVEPWTAFERFSDIHRPLQISKIVADLDVKAVISNDADGVHWDTGTPAAYTPMSVKPLTGEIVDDDEIYRRLPCPLLQARAAIVITTEATFSTVDLGALENLVKRGRLRRIMSDRATVFLPTDSACDG